MPDGAVFSLIRVHEVDWMQILLLVSPQFANIRIFTYNKKVGTSVLHTIWASTFELLALTALPPMLTEAAPSALLAPPALPPMRAEAAPSALLALTAHPPMLAEATPSALLAPLGRHFPLCPRAPSWQLSLLLPPSSRLRGAPPFV